MAEHHHRLAGLDSRSLDCQERARQRLGERGALGRKRGRERDDVARHQPRRQQDELAVGAVDEQEILAEIRAPGATRRTGRAWRRVRRDHAIAFAEAGDARADRRDRAGELVPEDRRNLRDHHGVTAAQGLHVGAARQRGIDAHDQLARCRHRHRQVLPAQIAGAVEDHRPHGVTYTFSASRRRIKSTPLARLASGTRWVMRRSTWIAPLVIRPNASARSDGDDE